MGLRGAAGEGGRGGGCRRRRPSSSPMRLLALGALHNVNRARPLNRLSCAGCRTLPSSPPVHPLKLPLTTAGVCLCLHPFLVAPSQTRPERLRPRHTPSCAPAPPTRCICNTHQPHTPATMSRLQQDQFVDDEEEECCPLCVEEFDLSDRNFRPCPCGYQVRSLRCPLSPMSFRPAVLTRLPDMPVLLQQHQDDDERAVPRLSPPVRRLHH